MYDHTPRGGSAVAELLFQLSDSEYRMYGSRTPSSDLELPASNLILFAIQASERERIKGLGPYQLGPNPTMTLISTKYNLSLPSKSHRAHADWLWH